MGAAIRDTPRCNRLVIEHVDLKGFAPDLGLPSEAKDWSNGRIAQEWEAAWRDALTAFAMGTHPRLGGARFEEGNDHRVTGRVPSHVFHLDQHVMELVGEAYWGPHHIEEEAEGEEDVPEWAWGRLRFLSIAV